MNKNWTTPVAIIIAGALIAVGIYFGSKAPDINIKDNPNLTAVQNIRGITEDEHIYGNPSAEILVLEYGDTECPPCKLFHETMHRVMNKYGKNGKVAWVFRHMPIVQLHSKAPKEAVATECAYEQGGNEAFWNYINKIYEITPSNDGLDLAKLPEIARDLGLNVKQFNECLSSDKYAEKVNNDYNDGLIATNNRPGTPHVKIIPIDGVTQEMVNRIEASFGAGQFSITENYISIDGAMRFEGFDLLLSAIFDAE